MSEETCGRCSSSRLASLSAKSSDRCYVGMVNSDAKHDGYTPDDMGIGGGDYIQFAWCLDCGTIQNDDGAVPAATFPLPPCALEKQT